MTAESCVAIVPYGTFLGVFPGRVPLNRLNWPLGQPARLVGKRIRDLSSEDHLLVYPTDTMHFRPGFGTKAKLSVMVVEPDILHKRHLDKFQKSQKSYHRVLTSSDSFLREVETSVFLAFGTTWVPDWDTIELTKTKQISLIASSKRDLEGHVLRHNMVSWMRDNAIDFDALGREYAPFEKKSDGLAAYRYSVVIENVRQKNYFTEKLVDALLCETVPIYWGCPNISEFFDTSGMIICNSHEDLHQAVLSASVEDYQKRLQDLRSVKAKAVEFADLEGRAARALLASV